MRTRLTIPRWDRRSPGRGLADVAVLIGCAVLGSTPAAAQQVSRVVCGPATVLAPGTSTCTVTLSAASSFGGLVVGLQSSDYTATVPPTVLVPQGTSSTEFTVTVGSLISDRHTLIIAFANLTAANFELAMVAPVQLLGVSCSPGALSAGQSATCTATLNKPTPAAVTVNLLSSSADLTVPATMTIASGAAGGTFTAKAGSVVNSQTVTATITANWTTSVTTIVGLGTATTVGGPIVTGVVDGANGWSTNNCSSGSWRSITGGGFASQPVQSGSPTTNLGGVQVAVNGVPAQMVFASPSLVTFQCPVLPAGTPLQVSMTTPTGNAGIPIQTMQEAAPAIFVVDAARVDQGLVLIGNSDTIAMPLTEGFSSAPAARGQYVSIFATGLGDVHGTAPALAQNTITVWIGGISVTPSFAGWAPGSQGLFQVIAPVPAGVTPGPSIPLYLQVGLANGSAVPSNEVVIAVN